MHYLFLLALATISALTIGESRLVAWPLEHLFGIPRGAFYHRSGKHSKLVAVLKWPFLLALIGLMVPTPWSFDFILTFLGGLLVGWKDFRRQDPKLLSSQELLED